MLTTLIVLAAAHFVLSSVGHFSLYRSVSQLHPPKTRKVTVGADRVVCPTCETSYSFKQLNLSKTSPVDKAIVECSVCSSVIRVTFDEQGQAECRV